MKAKEYRDPTQTLPDAPPESTDCDCYESLNANLRLVLLTVVSK